MSITIERLLKDGVAGISRETTATSMAESLIGDNWTGISESSKKTLCVKGLAAIITAEVYKDRRDPHGAASYLDSFDRKEIERIHNFVCCPYTSHETNYRKKCDCIGYITKLPKDKQRLAMNAQKKTNTEVATGFAELDARVDKSKTDLIECIANVRANEILAGIMLHCPGDKIVSLLNFSIGDLEHWKTNSKNQCSAWEKRFGWFDCADKVMRDAGVSKLKELPSATIILLANQAKEIWTSE